MLLESEHLSSLTGIPITLSPVMEPGQIILVGSGRNSAAKIVMHPLDFWEMGTPPGSMERLKVGLDYLLSEATRKFDRLEARLAA